MRKITIIYGPAGSGKTNLANSNTNDPYHMLPEFKGYNQHKVIIIDDHQSINEKDLFRLFFDSSIVADNIYIISLIDPESLFKKLLPSMDYSQVYKLIDIIIKTESDYTHNYEKYT